MEAVILSMQLLDKLIRSIPQIARLLAFAAVLKHGTLVVWGQKIVGGDSNDVATALKGVDKINPHIPRILQS